MRYRVILPSGELADGVWDRAASIPDEVENSRGRTFETARLKILVEDDFGDEYEVRKWDL